MRILLDTNILIHREAPTLVRDDIGVCFQWMDRLGYYRLVHPLSVQEIERHSDPRVVRTFRIKIQSYEVLRTSAPDTASIQTLRQEDRTENDSIDTSLLAEVAAGRVDALITEDRSIHRKALAIGVEDSVFTIDGFLEKTRAENPDLADYDVLSVKKGPFGGIDLRDPFFDSFRADYPQFDVWFSRKSNEDAYYTQDEEGRVVAFLYLKREGEEENYSDITPPLSPGRRLKIGTFKVTANGHKLGERFLKIIFDNALRSRVQAIYVTMHKKGFGHERLEQLLLDWGFVQHGTKQSAGGREVVLVRDFDPQVNGDDPRKTFPYVSASARKYIVPIYPKYHSDLLPDSILRTEDPEAYADSESHRNALSKVYISRSVDRSMKVGDILIFYRTKSGGPAYYTSVATTMGIVQNVVTDIRDAEAFLASCRKRSVFSDDKLLEHWNYRERNRPFVVNFLYVSSFAKRPNLKQLKDLSVLREAPRGFEILSDHGFERLVSAAEVDKHLIVG